MKHLLINSKTGEKTLCEKVAVDGFDYYVSDEPIKEGQYQWFHKHESRKPILKAERDLANDGHRKLVIATNNPNLDIPKVVDVVEELCKKEGHDTILGVGHIWIEGYNKSQETHPYSKEDVLEFVDFVYRSQFDTDGYTQDKETEELLQLWEEQRPKKVYYK